MAELLFLGTGAAVSRPGQGNTALLLRDPAPRLLVDCGPSVPFALTSAGVDWSEVHTIFLTHRHGDHVLGLPLFLLRLLDDDFPLTIVGGALTLEVARAMSVSVYPELSGVMHRVIWLPLPEDRPAERELLPGLRLRTHPNAHPPGVPVLALRLDLAPAGPTGGAGASLAYSSDTAAAPHLLPLFRGVDLLIHEANFSAALEPDADPARLGDGTARNAARMAREAGCRRLALIHVAARYNGRLGAVRAEAAAEFAGEILLPEDGDVVTL